MMAMRVIRLLYYLFITNELPTIPRFTLLEYVYSNINNSIMI